MNSENKKFVIDWTSGYTKVMWNFQRYPLLDVNEIPRIYSNIESVLKEKFRFRGYMEIMAYGLQPDQYETYRNDEIHCDYFPDDTMTQDLLFLIRWNPVDYSERLDIALITKKNEIDRELFRILKALASRNHTVYLVEPPEVGIPFDFSKAEVLEGRSRPQTDDFNEDFSFPLLPISEAEPHVAIFWDATDYPFPDGVRDPDLMYDKIVRALVNWGFDATISIWAYVDETEEYWKDKLVKKTWNASIYFLPREDDGRLFHDVILWIKDNPITSRPFGWTIVIVNEPRTSDKTVFDWLKTFNTRCRRYDPDPDNYCLYRMKLSALLESESESESERDSEEGSSKKAKLLD